MNPTLKHLGERALLRSGIPGMARRTLRHGVLVLAYHNVVPEGVRRAGDASLHLSQSDFAKQLDLLAQTQDVVPIDQLMTPVSPSPRSRVIITFDDAYHGALTAGIDELSRRGMPATIFVAPALLGTIPWWDTLADPETGIIPDEVRQHALHALGGRADRILAWGRSLANPAHASALPRIGSEPDLARAASKPGITLGSHTWSHPNLCGLDGAELETELTEPLRWLGSRFPREHFWLSFPYGCANTNVERLAASVGYAGSFRIDGGWMRRFARPSQRMPRLNIPAGLSLDGFRLRLAGMF